jgi:hypothetical protein
MKYDTSICKELKKEEELEKVRLEELENEEELRKNEEEYNKRLQKKLNGKELQDTSKNNSCVIA